MAIINKFGGNTQVAGDAVFIKVAAAAVADTFPVTVATGYTLPAGSPPNVIVISDGAYAISLPAASQDLEGASFSFCFPVAANDVTVTAPDSTFRLATALGVGAAAKLVLTGLNDTATVTCVNASTPTVAAWYWFQTAGSLAAVAA